MKAVFRLRCFYGSHGRKYIGFAILFAAAAPDGNLFEDSPGREHPTGNCTSPSAEVAASETSPTASKTDAFTGFVAYDLSLYLPLTASSQLYPWFMHDETSGASPIVRDRTI